MERIKPWIKYLFLAGLIYFPVFGHLDTLPIRIWDEARVAMNAYEMYYNGDYIVTHFNGLPDLWNTKPPLLIWFQVFFMKIVGVNELAVRLPSAIAALITCVVLLIFSKRFFKNAWIGLFTVFILITSHGYITIHGSRTGDYDALLALFTTVSGLLFFAYCERQNYKHLYLFFLFTALAVLTKSVTGLLFLPAIFIYSILQKQLIPLLKNKHFYFGLLSFLVIVVGYYLLREVKNPGYFAAVQANELGGRFAEVIEEHQHGFWFYFNNITNFQLPIWYLFIPCGFIVGFLIKDEKINRITLFLFLMTITFFLVISNAQTKIVWYDVPLYPFFAIIIAIFVNYIFEFLQDAKWFHQTLSVNVTPFIFLFVLGTPAYQNILDKTYKPAEQPQNKNFYEIGYFLQEAVEGKHNLDNHYILYDGYNTQNLFYIRILNDNGVNCAFKDWRNLNDGDTVVAHQKSVKKYLRRHYNYNIVNRNGIVVTYNIYGKK